MLFIKSEFFFFSVCTFPSGSPTNRSARIRTQGRPHKRTRAFGGRHCKKRQPDRVLRSTPGRARGIHNNNTRGRTRDKCTMLLLSCVVRVLSSRRTRTPRGWRPVGVPAAGYSSLYGAPPDTRSRTRYDYGVNIIRVQIGFLCAFVLSATSCAYWCVWVVGRFFCWRILRLAEAPPARRRTVRTYIYLFV